SSQIDSLFVDHCLFQYNQRDSTGFYGTSCIYLYEISFCKISHSSFLYSNNSDNANLHFWLFNTDANVEIDHCNFIDNRNLNSSGRGGAIRMDEGTSLTITNSLFVDNYAHRYGASYSWPIDTKIFNCTFTDNTSWGGTVGCQNAHVENSIFYGNHHTVSSKQLIVSAGSVVKNCNIEGEPSGGGITISGLINSNPRFLGYGEYPYSLSPYSNCINAGSIDTTGLNLSATDLAGNPRIYNGNQGRIDMGAYEYQGDPPPRVQTCLDFDGANDYVSGTGIDTTLTAITLEAWVNHDTLPVEIQRYITVQPEMAVIRYDGFFGYRSLHFYIKKADGALYGIRADSVLTPGEWTHVAGTYDGTIMKLYVNGELIKSASPAGGLFPSNGGFSISGGEAMDGRIDQVRIWSVARTANEIREDMHVEIPMYQLGLVSYWNFDEGDGNMTYDRYGINDGTLQNMDNADWVVSSMPFGEGVSDSKTEIPGLVDFTGTDLIMDFNAQNGAEITVSRIDALPNIFPAGPDHVFDGQYWVVHRYGTGNFDADLTFTLSEDLTAEDMANPGNISLYTRGSTADTAWAFLASAGLVNAANNTATFENITGFSQFIIAREINLGIELNLSAYLEGPFNGTEMNTNIFGYLPLSQPYNTAPWNYTGTEAVAAIPNTDVVDWILVELRDAPDAASAGSAAVVARQAGFLLKDGSVVSIDGQSMLQFAGLSVQHSIFAVVRHRNHIAVMSAIPLTESGGVYSYDFTTGAVQAHGGTLAHKEIAPGIWGLTAADGNADNQVNNGDKNDVWAPQAGTGGYTSGDFNLDAQVNNGDKNDMWAPNTGLGGQVPQ
ncbi:MAG: hypothetical protein JXA03_14420, partial [Bacteroidales bacterium]|nr:hypothetical protein [Bacteroidales bacterium]